MADLNCVDMNINPQTLAMLLDFLKISPGASSDRVVRGKQAVNDFLNEMGDSTKIAAAEVDTVMKFCVISLRVQQITF